MVCVSYEQFRRCSSGSFRLHYREPLVVLHDLDELVLLGFVIWLAFSRYGEVRLGKEGEEPEFGRVSWIAMLFQAGMGLALVLWGVS